MATSIEIKQRANTLADKTDVNSITPKEVGGIMYDLASHGENVLRNGGTLGIRKVYESVAAMEADSTNPKDFWGDPIKKGNLVVIYDGTTTGVDNNKIYAFMKPGWELATKLDAAYATKAETDAKLAELGSEVRLVKSITNIFTKVSEKNNIDNSYAGDFVDVKLLRNEDVYNGVNIVLCREFYNKYKRLFFNHYDGSRSQGTLVFDSNGIAQIDIDESVDNVVIADFNAELKTTIYVYSNPQQYLSEKISKDVDDKLNKGLEGVNMLLEYMTENLSQAAWVSKLPNNSKLQNSVGNNIITSGAYFNLPINPYSQSFDLKLEFDIIFDSTSIQYEGHPNFYWWSINNMVLRGEGWVGKTKLEVGKKYNITLNYLKYSGKIQVFIDGIIEAEGNVTASINTNINFQLFGLEKGKNNVFANIVARRKRIKVYINEELKHNLYAIELGGRYGYYDSIGALCYFSESDVEFIKG